MTDVSHLSKLTFYQGSGKHLLHRAVWAILALSVGVLALVFAPRTALGQSLYDDPTARERGDVITIVLSEQTTAQRESSYEGSSSSEVGANGSTSGGGIASQFGADAQINSNTENANQTAQSGQLQGTITARVTGVNEAGNLFVEGKRKLTINGVTHVISVEGLVRPEDLQFNNRILSTQVANAKINYGQDGSVRRGGIFSRGNLLQVGSAVLVGLGVFLGLR